MGLRLSQYALVSLCLIFALSVNAQDHSYTISGSHSAEDGGCLSPVPIFTAEDCSADGTSPHLGDAGTTWTGPAWTAAYYLNDSASSPYI